MTRAIDTLLSIMQDPDAWLGRRIEAADGLLSYEAPADYVEAAKAFLITVFEDPEQDDEFRMKTLKLVRKVEARKVMPSTTKPRDDRLSRDRFRTHLRAQRRAALMRAGLWPAPAGWDSDIESAEPPHDASEGPEGMADRLKDARLRRTTC